ncbi:hypothetical protein KQX54_006113 [Cotesia glomerata]|uniref:Uncharacterized protein n=1 Tax=Cotesia glomerata TaxID=32391 RepID=A0AAV7IDA3_COTGL|nr:hypothetical protein KQX54_006113 [Cotesia glomerata]
MHQSRVLKGKRKITKEEVDNEVPEKEEEEEEEEEEVEDDEEKEMDYGDDDEEEGSAERYYGFGSSRGERETTIFTVHSVICSQQCSVFGVVRGEHRVVMTWSRRCRLGIVFTIVLHVPRIAQIPSNRKTLEYPKIVAVSPRMRRRRARRGEERE